MGKKGLLAFKILFVFVSFYFLYKLLDFKTVLFSLGNLNLALLGLSIFLIIPRQLLQSFRFQEILRVHNQELSFATINKDYLIGYFYNFFLPTSIGGDVARVISMSKNNIDKTTGVNYVLIERLIGLFSLSVIGFVSVFFGQFPKMIVGFMFLFFFGFILLFVIFNFFKENALVVKFVKPQLIESWKTKGLPIFGYILVLSLVFQLFSIFVFYLLAYSFGIKVSFLSFLVFLPIINIVILLPLSINGMGLRELAYIYFFDFVDLPKEDSFTMALSSYTMLIVLGLGGWIVNIFSLYKK